MFRGTKIVATLGPASNDLSTLERMISAGVNVVRLNFSHGTADDHIARAALARQAAENVGRTVGILADLQGPKIRVGKFADGAIQLAKGDRFILDAQCELGNQERVGLDYKNLPRDVQTGAVLLLDDGRIVLDVERVDGDEIHTVVRIGGKLSNNKGINQQGGGLSAPALTVKDKQDLKTAVALAADYIAVSFPKSGDDMREARNLVAEANGHALLVAKIERTEAITNLTDILLASDGIMVARGDLAVEVGDAAVPALQKRMIREARLHNKFAITATQMMESMITAPIPTRAEVSDVANAVLDGTDAVMLSAESAAGQYPVETVEAMARVCAEAEKSYVNSLDEELLNREQSQIDQSIAMAALFTAQHIGVKAIAALTQSGSTTQWMSRVDSGVPIYAVTPEESTRRKVSIFRDVFPLKTDAIPTNREAALAQAERALLEHGAVQRGDLLLMTIGEPLGKPGGTNTMLIVRVGEYSR
ncbi:pyruvate kinase [Crenobacter sp. SG2303]|uniref:Pyruvate kinase n=1 Tax=Crenobacter oryzisoli TaxID=3056844 RepID=A0ABT7XJN7_9NEIS|nr:pyruvate kinase [Crenobacter sp. SG2303]MDN0073955.1 pyruvate kinase [Crenobacter sp. SG2303]